MTYDDLLDKIVSEVNNTIIESYYNVISNVADSVVETIDDVLYVPDDFGFNGVIDVDGDETNTEDLGRERVISDIVDRLLEFRDLSSYSAHSKNLIKLIASDVVAEIN